jgi:hypothetical protein
MAIVGSELNYYQSKVVNDTSSNGGRISSTLITSGLSNSWWPNISEADLATGITQYRKGFVRVDNAANTVGTNLRVGLFRPTPGSDELYLAKGTQTNIQSQWISTPPNYYGCGQLDASVLTGANSITVLVEDGAKIIFRSGDLIRISNETSLGTGGTAEVHTISGTPSIAGDVVTITLVGTLANDYSDTNTYVSSLISEATVTGTVTGKVVTSTAGTFNEALVTVSNLGSIYQTLTFTFSNPTTFTVSSDEGISLAGGTTGNTYAPTHVAAGASYLSIPPAAWGGTFANLDTVVFTTVPPCVPIIEKRVVPAGSAAIASQTRTLMFFIES